MTQQPGSSLHAVESWIADTVEKITHGFAKGRPVRKCRLVHEDLTFLLDVERNPRTSEYGFSVAVAHRRFAELLRGWGLGEREEEDWPILLGNGGLLRDPFLAIRLTSQESAAVAGFVQGVAEDVRAFVSALSSLDAIHAELTAEVPKFKYVDPRAKPRRALYSAVVSCLLHRPWNELMETARKSRISGDSEWAAAVDLRLSNFASKGN